MGCVSIRDRQVFDRLPLVAERYLNSRGRKDLEIWNFHRRVQTMTAGKTLRIQAPGQFLLRWSIDGGNTFQESAAIESGLGIGFVDIKTIPGQTTPIQFSLKPGSAEPQDSATYEVKLQAKN